jgi:hypothetical protein
MKALLITAAVSMCVVFSSPLQAREGKTNQKALPDRLSQFDVNGDGQLSAEEKAAAKANPGKGAARLRADRAKADGESKVGRQQQVLAEFDANGNGTLEPDEKAAARKAAAERRKNRKKARSQGGQPTGAPESGLESLNGQPLNGAGPRGDGRAKLLEKFDFNRDGQLSPEEMARAKQIMQQLGAPGQNGANLPPGFLPPGKRKQQ